MSAIVREGPGWLARCACGWESFAQIRGRADAALAKHTCPQPKATRAETKPRPRASWDDREDSTWIDKI